jgi:hypothetical protein
MAQNAYIDDVPTDLLLDLLVDGELPEQRRRALLVSLDGQPEQWRDLALRFLQQQTEKQTVQALVAGGNLVPVADARKAPVRRPILGRVGWQRLTAIAAGLFIAASSALVTLVAVRTPSNPAVAAPTEFVATVPPEAVASDRPLSVSVPVVPASDNTAIFQVNRSGDRRATRTTILVQPDGNDGYMVIPVSMSRAQIY